MVVKADKKHLKDICNMWCEAFGDREETVEKYLDFLMEYIFVAETDGKAISMAAAIPVTFGNACGRYVYAVATKNEYRGQGLSSEILDFLKAHTGDFLILVPAEKSLFEFYEKRGFYSSNMRLKKTAYNAKTTLVKAVPIDEKEYCIKRKEYKKDLIAFDEQILKFAKKMYDGDFFKTDSGVAFCFCDSDKVVVKEILADNVEKTLDSICRYYDRKIAEYMLGDNEGNEFFMCYPEINGYFNIAMD